MDYLSGKVRLATGNAIWKEAEALEVGLLRHKNSLKNVLFLTNSNILLLDCTRPQLAGTKGSISQSPKTAVANAKREITQKNNEGAVAGVDNVRR